MHRLAHVILAALALAAGCGDSGDDHGPADEPVTVPTAATTEPAPEPTATAAVACREGEAPALGNPSVAVQPDGAHLEIENATGVYLLLEISSVDDGRTLDATEGTTSQVVDMPPGTWYLSCRDPEAEEDAAAPAAAPLEVVDPAGHWVPPGIDCEDVSVATLDHAPGTRGTSSDPIAAATEALASYDVEPDDVLEPAGYPEGYLRRVRVVRSGETIAVVELLDDTADGWLPTAITRCASLTGGDG